MENGNGVYHVEYITNGANITVVDSENYIVRSFSVFVSDENVNGYEQCLQNLGYRRTFINIKKGSSIMIDGVSMEEATKNISSFMEYYYSGEWRKKNEEKTEDYCKGWNDCYDAIMKKLEGLK